jgi:Heparinase II/III-like protein/Heparinase II/III N-terminus
MDAGRLYRTVRYLSLHQWVDRFLCRGRFAMMEKRPQAARRHFQAAIRQIPPLDPLSPNLAKVASHVTQLQRAVHGSYLAGIPRGRFTLLNREVDFGRLETLEWRKDLGEKNNRLWRMNLAYMGYLVPLFEADARAALPIANNLLVSLREQNPWSARGIFRDVWHPYTASHRVINLLVCLHFAARSGVAQQSPDLKEIIDEIQLGAAFVLGNLERDLQYNHLLKNFVCLAAVVSAATAKSKFAAKVLREVEDSVEQQFLKDGGQAERAPMYHLLSLLDLRILRDSGALPAKAYDAVCQAEARGNLAANAMIHPDGDVALFNDSWRGEAPLAADLVNGLDPRPGKPLRIELPVTGYARLAHRGDNLIIDFGACGPDDNPGHAHADFLSFELSVAGLRALVDPGVPTYNQGPARNASRSAHWHNGPAFENEEPIEFWSSFRVGRRGYAYKLPLEIPDKSALTFAAWQSGYSHIGAVVARAVWLMPGRGLLIADIWMGAPARQAFSRFLIGDEWNANKDNPFAFSSSSQPDKIAFRAMEGEIIAETQTQYWQRFGLSRNASCVKLLPAWDHDLRIAGLWLDWASRESTPMEEWSLLRAALLKAALPLRDSPRSRGPVSVRLTAANSVLLPGPCPCEGSL